ncbi:MAG: hypothetical protein EXQ48_01825 [Acidobacteria bacterium]|nr:hypothetical protein [Acidobacteriota bacterium]
MIAASSAVGAQARVTLPGGVAGVSFGKAHRYKDASGKEMCSIVQPLADPPVFERGVMEISYGVHLEQRRVTSASTQVIAPAPPGALQRVPCNVFLVVKGGFSQTQLGSTLSRLDEAPLQTGRYLLRITIDGQAADVPFSIK